MSAVTPGVFGCTLSDTPVVNCPSLLLWEHKDTKDQDVKDGDGWAPPVCTPSLPACWGGDACDNEKGATQSQHTLASTKASV